MELRGQMTGKKVLPYRRQTPLACDALWEFGRGREPMTLTSHSGFKQLCPASHWPVDTGDDKVWGPGGLCVAVSLEALSLLAMEVKGGVLTRLWELPGGSREGWELLMGSQTIVGSQLRERLGENELDFEKNSSSSSHLSIHPAVSPPREMDP